MDKPLRFSPGDAVYARWFGAETLEVVERATVKSVFPHWICKSWGGKKYDFYIVPQIHLSSCDLVAATGINNRKQLSLFN